MVKRKGIKIELADNDVLFAFSVVFIVWIGLLIHKMNLNYQGGDQGLLLLCLLILYFIIDELRK